MHAVMFKSVFTYTDPEMKVTELPDGISLSCGDQNKIISLDGSQEESVKLTYGDDNTGEYRCVHLVDGSEVERPKIFVKFRSKSCSNTGVLC